MSEVSTPLLFGESQRPLYGVYYGAPPTADLRRAVLLCPPIGHEYMRSYLTFDKLAKRLAKSGWAAFKFDYAATGDSAGDTAEGSSGAWVESIRLAGRELLERSQADEIAVVGMRLGATLAAALPAGALPVTALVGWDPVVSGADYLADLEALHAAFLAGRPARGRPDRAQPRDDEIIGFAYPDAMRRSIVALDMSEGLATFRGQALLVSSSASRDAERCREIAAASGDRAAEVVPDACEWDAPGKVHDAVLGAALPARIADYLETLRR